MAVSTVASPRLCAFTYTIVVVNQIALYMQVYITLVGYHIPIVAAATINFSLAGVWLLNQGHQAWLQIYLDQCHIVPCTKKNDSTEDWFVRVAHWVSLD